MEKKVAASGKRPEPRPEVEAWAKEAYADSEESELPIVYAVAVCKAPKGSGWVTIGLGIQGTRVVEQELLQAPDSKALALERGKIAFVNRFALDRGWNAR